MRVWVCPQVGQSLLKKYCKALHLQCREASLALHFDISNLDSIGRTEVEIVQNMVDGVCSLLDLEQRMVDGVCSLLDLEQRVQDTPQAVKSEMMVVIEGE